MGVHHMKNIKKVAAIAALASCALAASGAFGATQRGAHAVRTAVGPAAAYRPYFQQRWGGHGGAAVTPAQVEAMLARQTPQQVVNALYGSGENSRWDTVARGIAHGERAWLNVAVRLSGGTDAGTSDDFAIAASDALTVNPAGTLRLLSRIPMGAGACEENGFEVPRAQARAFYRAALASVATVRERGLQRIKGQCLASLRHGLAALGR
jgi:hypothetical protein